MGEKNRGRGLAAAFAVAAVVATAAPVSASEPLDELIAELSHCRAWADEPGGNPIVGSGGASCRAIHGEIIGTVCLVYNGATVASSCNVLRSSDGSDSRPTKPTRCLPGLWQTQTTVVHAHSADTEVVSDPVLLTCLN